MGAPCAAPEEEYGAREGGEKRAQRRQAKPLLCGRAAAAGRRVMKGAASGIS